MDDMLKQADKMGTTIGIMQRMYELDATDGQPRLTAWCETTHELQDVTDDLRDHLANFDDFFRPIRNYFHWEPHCYQYSHLLVIAIYI